MQCADDGAAGQFSRNLNIKQKINDRVMRQRTFHTLFLLVSFTAFGQDYPKNENLVTIPTTYQTNDVNLNDQILKYQEFLRDETKSHREYTQEYYAMIISLLRWIIVGVGVVIGAVLGWLSWKTKNDIENQINQRIQEKTKDIENQVNQRIQELIIGFINISKEEIEEKNKVIQDSYDEYLKLYGLFLDAKFLKCTKCVGFTSYNENKGTETNPICKICADTFVKQVADNMSNEGNIVEN